MKSRWVSGMARHLELPAEAFGVTRLVVVGGERVDIENHRGLLAFTPQEVVCLAQAGRVVVEGQDLTLELLGAERLRVVGRIQAIRLQG